MGILGLKIDVDTYLGMKEGVPRLLETLKEFRVKGTFFLSVGPDNSGRAVLQLFKNPLFFKKMVRTNAVGLYGWRTALYGTLLKAPMIALSFPGLVRAISDEGHEVQFHAWDHRRWQDELPDKSEDWIREWFTKGTAGLEKLTGRKPTAFGAPSWLIDDRVLSIIKSMRFDYVSCTRAREAFIHDIAELLEIPSDLPCFEELNDKNDVAVLTELINIGGIHVLPVHAEVEGGIFNEKFRRLLRNVIDAGNEVVLLNEIRNKLAVKDIPVRKYKMELLSGRHSACAV